eukprot:CAMPEP_0196728526 /NCGR_PEP_ID=MMETSP1091-20130531/9173_1 /TAXON_ID=302021 /ORGANISM="Rhodomonas sp., Strain CCMP768" /LENGTH=225 /DNA_ID=CAMNT_0042071281 /DNA_START=32 /DNA_END=709 /DNA_ORIENTATION=+
MPSKVLHHYLSNDFVRSSSHAVSVDVYPRRKAGQACLGSDRPPVKVTYDLLAPFFGRPLQVVAKRMGLCCTALKKACRKLGIERWPNTSKGESENDWHASQNHPYSEVSAKPHLMEERPASHRDITSSHDKQQEESDDGWRKQGGVWCGAAEGEEEQTLCALWRVEDETEQQQPNKDQEEEETEEGGFSCEVSALHGLPLWWVDPLASLGSEQAPWQLTSSLFCL